MKSTTFSANLYALVHLLFLLALPPPCLASPTPAPAPLPPNPTSAIPHPRKKLISFTDAFSGSFQPQRSTYVWVDSGSGDDGSYVVTDSTSNTLVFANVATGNRTTFMNFNDVKDPRGKTLKYSNYEIQPSRKHVLFSANVTKKYRYSFTADYYVHDVRTSKTVPLVPGQNGDIQYAGWSTRGDTIAFVRGNDLYVWRSGEVSRITYDGGPDLFNAVPDWVYEEEIYGDNKVLWWSPDGKYLAFLKMNETGVPTYNIQYYMGDAEVAPPYPKEVQLRYPKVGEKNPTVSFHLLKLGEKSAAEIGCKTFEDEDLLITEVAWVTEGHSHVMFRTMNRVQDREKLVLVDLKKGRRTKVVRERDGTDGWLENNLAIQYVPKSNPPAYLDLSDHLGYTHIYLYPRDGSSLPKALTSGDWEVTSVTKVDTKRGIVYYLSTERDSTERHLYSVSLTKPGEDKQALVDVKSPGFWAASFSEDGGFYLLSYNGPEIPWQKLYSVSADGKKHKLVRSVNDNAELKTKLAEYKLPQLRWSTLKHPDGYELNVLERLPANFNPHKKYPVLFDIYGGPSSQETSKTFRNVDWDTYVGSDPELEYIVLHVDNRGTGFKGRAFRCAVTSHLGKLEAADQVFAANEWATKPYVDKEHMVIWGWSFGGYLTAKVIELNADVFTRAIATAPVSDWRFYDTMYTERYMKTLSANPDGYRETAVRDVQGFKEIRGGFLIQHGTGDDNVHFQNSAVLTDMLVRQGVRPEKLRVMWFTDNDHSMRRVYASGFLYRQLTEELFEEKRRVPQKGKKHQWQKRRAGSVGRRR